MMRESQIPIVDSGKTPLSRNSCLRLRWDSWACPRRREIRAHSRKSRSSEPKRHSLAITALGRAEVQPRKSELGGAYKIVAVSSPAAILGG